MPINSSGPGDASIHRHSGDCETDLSGKYAEYIDEHRDALLAKCQRVNNCIEGLLKDENILLLLKGDNLSLNKTCSLIYENRSGAKVQNGQCTTEDREDIREDLEQHLILQLDDAKLTGWKNVKRCLSVNYGDTERSTYVNEICSLALKNPQICESRGIHKNVTTFFNNQIQHLQCTCRSLGNSLCGPTCSTTMPSVTTKATEPGNITEKSNVLPFFLGGLAGGLLLLLIFCAIGWIVCRRRRASRKSKKQASNRIYLPAPTADNYPVYQELYDDKGYNAYGKYPSGQPPALPMRYARNPAAEEDEPAYLEPVEAGFRFRPKLPVPGRENPSYGAPPEYSERAAVPLNKSDAENGYFEPLPNPGEDSGLQRNPANPENGYETVVEVLSSDSENATSPGDVRIIPTHSKRSQGSRQGEPGGVKLEQDGSRKAVDTTV